MHDLELPQYRRRIRGEDHFLEVVDDDLVAAIGPERGLNGLGNGPAGVDVANDCSIFGVVAVVGWLAVYTVVVAGLLETDWL